MRIFLSALEGSEVEYLLDQFIAEGKRIPFGLVSYYYIQKSKKAYSNFKKCLQICDYVLVDSGAHSFQEGARVPWNEYTESYAKFIKENDHPKILGFFEMDVDAVIGYEKVLELRKILESVSDKIIPVWHKNRGVSEFKKMCQTAKSEIVAVTGFRNEDISDNQYAAFLKYAWKCGKKIHCLGMTRKKVLDKVPFDLVDSSSWKMAARYGQVKQWSNRKHSLVNVPNTKGKFATKQIFRTNLIAYIELVKYYNVKWQKINHDLHFRFGVRNIHRLIKLLKERFKTWGMENSKKLLKVEF